VTGEIAYRKQAEEMLRSAEQQTQGNVEARKSYQEYAERIRYRLDTREIIDKPEYDRKFRSDQSKK
jgi:hypothetical protein